MEEIRFALVGCGSIGRRHVAVIDAEPGARIVGLCDVVAERHTELAELYGDLPTYPDLPSMLDGAEADVVVVATPHDQHCEQTILACQAGRHVLVEKPMALTREECLRMNAAAHKQGVRLWVVKQNRYNVPVRLAAEVIRNGVLGRIFLVKCDILWNRYQGYYDDSPWRGKLAQEGGALYTQASHFIDLLIWWCGSVVSASGHMETQAHDIETEDSGVAMLEFESGAMGSLVWTTCVHEKNYEGSITIVAENGTIKIGGRYLNKIEYWDVLGHPLPEGVEFTDKPNQYGLYQGTSSNHDKVLKGVIADLRREPAETVDGFEGMKSVDAIEKAYHAIRR